MTNSLSSKISLPSSSMAAGPSSSHLVTEFSPAMFKQEDSPTKSLPGKSPKKPPNLSRGL